jgi:GTPase
MSEPSDPSPAENGVHRSGTVAIIGRANVGKSTLLNAALRERLAIVTPTPQTTRDRILGVVRHGDAQIALIDTPGLHRPQSRLGRRMNTTARDVAQEADVLVFVTSIPRTLPERLLPSDRDVELLRQVDPECRSVLVINKIDLLGKNKAALLPLLAGFAEIREFSAVVPISALKQDGVELVLDEIAKLLPVRGPEYDEDFLTDRPLRFFASEFVREQVTLVTRQEIPHNVAVSIERFEDEENLTRIDATVRVARENQRGIIIGKGGERLKGIGIAARQRIEALLGRHVHLRLWVSTDPGWPESSQALDSLGYVSLTGRNEEPS